MGQLIRTGQCADAAPRPRAARSGFARAMAFALVLAFAGLSLQPAWASTVTRVWITSDAGSDNTYAVGHDITVSVSFASVVHVDQTDDCDTDPKLLTLVLSIGEHSREATFIEGSGTSVLKFRYTVVSGDKDDDGISIGPGDRWLRGACIVTATNTAVTRSFSGLGNNTSHKVDGIPPRVTTMAFHGTPDSGDTYRLGEDIEVNVTFDEIVHVNESSTELVLLLSIGQHSRRATYIRGSGNTQLRFRYTVQAGDDDDDGISIGAGPGSLVGARIEDAAGNPADRAVPGLPRDINRKVDGASPSITTVSISSTPKANQTYGPNEDIKVDVTFGENVYVDETQSQLVLVLSIGQHSRSATFVDGSGTATLKFSYTVQSDDKDDDGISIGPNALRGGRIEDADRNVVNRTTPALERQAAHMVNGTTSRTLPTVSFASSPDAGQTYRLNETVKVRVAFGEAVHVTGALTLVLAIGEHSRAAALADGSGTNTLTFSYTVQSDDKDDDGISIGPNALRGGVIEDANGNQVNRTLAGRAADGDHKVNGATTSPSLPTVSFASTPVANQTYGLNEAIRVNVSFGARVHVTGALTLVLSIGENSRAATFVGGSGTDTLEFRYVVQSEDYDGDGVSIGANALQGGRIEDANGNLVNRRIAAQDAATGHKVDGATRSRAAVRIVSTPASGGTYRLNEAIRVEVEFGTRVRVTGPGTLALNLSIGDNTRVATFVGGSGTDTLTFRYVVQSEDYDGDGVSIGANALVGRMIQDAQNNDVDRSFVRLEPDRGHRVDGSARALRTVRIISTPASGGVYGLNETIRVEIDFGEDVHVSGSPSMMLSIGEHVRTATLADGSGSPKLTFRYVVRDGDEDTDGISIGPNALQGGVIQNSSGEPVERTFAGLAANRSHRVDGVSPALNQVRIVSPPGHRGTYGVNDEITITIDFGEEVHVKDEVTVDITIGEHTRKGTFVTGSGTDTLTFRYVVRSDDFDDDGISIPPDCLVGIVRDVAGNPVNREYRGRASDSRHKVDGLNTARLVVQIVPPRGHDGIYGLNEEIRVVVDVPEQVHVTGAPILTLSIGEHSREATLVNGSGSKRLTFSYVVRSDDQDDDGISIGPNALRGGVIETAAGNAVARVFTGVPVDIEHRVDGVSPSLSQVRIVPPAGHNGIYGLNEEIRVDVDFGEDVHVTSGEAELVIMLSIGQHLRAASFVGGSGTDTLTFRYLVQAGDVDDDGVSIGPNALQGGMIKDAAGNDVVRTFKGLPADKRYRVKTIPAVVAPVAAVQDVVFTSNAGPNDTYTTGDHIRLDVVFNVPVYVTGNAPVLKLSIGSVLRDAIFQEGSGKPTLKFQYTVVAGDIDEDGISIGPSALTGTLEDQGGNAVDLTLPAKQANRSHMVSAELMLFPLSMTLLVGQSELINLTDQLKLLGVDYDGRFKVTSDDAGVATASLSGRMLTITSVAEGTATISAKAIDAAIYLNFGVTVSTSPEEAAVLEDAFAAVGRGMIASASSTIGGRLETAESDTADAWGGSRLAPVSVAAPVQWSALDGIGHREYPFGHLGGALGHGPWALDDPYLARSSGYTLAQWLRGARFEMPFRRGVGNRITSLSVWGAGDWHAFEGEPESGLYDGSLTSLYLGFDARGRGWISGAALSHAIADASYEFGGAVAGKGRLETELNVIHPYVQWAFRERGKVWAILGFGTGEATAEREGQEASKASSDLSMMMGLGGMRYAFGPWAGFDFAARGDIGFAQLETDEGPRAIQGLMVNVQRLRMGVEASLPMALGGVPVSPFIDIGGRYDGGDGATGGGVELAGGFRYRSPMVGLELKGRALAMHADDRYSEEGVKATLIVGPDGRRGFRLLLSPRWGGTAEAMDIFAPRGHPFAGALRRENRGWGLGTRVSYGFDMLRRPGTVMPFAEVDVSGDARRRARLGLSYEVASAVLGLPHRLEISGESTDSDRHGSIMRFLLTGQAHF